jgi:hypothetical protein
MSISSRREGEDIHPYYSALSFLHNLTESQNIEEHDDDNGNTINNLDIAEGLKDMLVSNGIKLESLLIVQPPALSEMLGIDEYVAKIIISAAHDIKNSK